MAYERLDLQYGDSLNADVFKHIEDGIEALDLALDSKVVEVEKTHYGTNRFDKDTIPFLKPFYVSNNLRSDKVFSTTANTKNAAGSGWLNIPVVPGKTYTMSVRNPVTLSNFNNEVYGVFSNIFFLDASGCVVATVSGNSNKGYYYSINGDTSNVSEVNYSTKKVICKSYSKPSDASLGIYTNAMTVTIVDENICCMHVQVGAKSFGGYQLNADFYTGGHLTDEQAAQIHNSFQINEGTELLEYEEFGDYNYIDQVVESNLTKLQSAFTTIEVPSTNLFDPVNHVMNHTFVHNGSLNNGAPRYRTVGYTALFKIPINEPGQYVLHCNRLFEFGNKSFGYFGDCIFTDESDKIITTNYKFVNGVIDTTLDTTKVTISGITTSTLKFNIIDESIKYIITPLLDSDKNTYGAWSNYENKDGLTDDELLEIASMIQLNKGTKILPYKTFYDVSFKSVIGPENIQGLDSFMEDTSTKIEEAISNIKFTDDDKDCVCLIEDNNIFVRAKQYTEYDDFVWSLEKINTGQENKYFNITSMNTCPKNTLDEETSGSLTLWKSSPDDICPPNVLGTYIAANHGFNCVDKVTVTSHNKTEKDIGSVWVDSKNKTYVLTHIYSENVLGFVMFNDSNMADGKMGYGSPDVGSTMTHQNGATNTNSIIIEGRENAQLRQCFNHYSIKLYIDGKLQDINVDSILYGNKVEIFTQYDVIYVPAILRYLMDNVGNNTIDSHHSDNINDSYMTMYINYQFNKNGSMSTYSSFYINKNMNVGYIGLVQSIKISNTPYTYIPDTTYKILTLNDGSAAQRFDKDCWLSEEKCPYRFYQFADDTADKGIGLIYDRTIGWGKNDIRKEHLTYAGMYYTSKKMYPAFIAGGSLTPGTYFDGMAARVPLYKYDPDLTSVGWYWSGDDIHLMIDTHSSVNKDIVLPDYMNNMRIEVLDKTDSVTMEQTYIFNGKLRFQCTDYGYAVLRLYK